VKTAKVVPKKEGQGVSIEEHSQSMYGGIDLKTPAVDKVSFTISATDTLY
tara:strand:- start:346 stop:495 length:150 start_codon:yes stop_codon:yes gene_type:complete